MVARKRKRAGGYSTPKAKGKKKTKHIFVKKHPVIGVVPMLFFVPKCSGRKELVEEIQNNGGIVTDGYEAFVYQIKIPTLRSRKPSTFHRGFVYKSDWILDSIAQGKLIDVEDSDDYLVGFHKKSTLCTIPKNKKKQYTITEVLKIWEVYEQEGYKKNITKTPPLSFFQKIEAQNIIPDRTATSLRTAWKKFSAMPKAQFIRAALKKAGTRYSHNFADAPEVPEPVKRKASKKNLTSLLNTASTKPRGEECSANSLSSSPKKEATPKRKKRTPKAKRKPSISSSESEYQEEDKDDEEQEEEEEEEEKEELELEMDVHTKEPSIIDNEGDEMEFILAIEDMQSAISHGPEDVDTSYNLNSRKKKKSAPLGVLCENYTEQDLQRVKVTESATYGTIFNESDTTIYDQDDLYDFVANEAKIVIHSNLDHKYTVESTLPKKTREEAYFREITNQLEEY